MAPTILHTNITTHAQPSIDHVTGMCMWLCHPKHRCTVSDLKKMQSHIMKAKAPAPHDVYMSTLHVQEMSRVLTWHLANNAAGVNTLLRTSETSVVVFCAKILYSFPVVYTDKPTCGSEVSCDLHITLGPPTSCVTTDHRLHTTQP